MMGWCTHTGGPTLLIIDLTLVISGVQWMADKWTVAEILWRRNTAAAAESALGRSGGCYWRRRGMNGAYAKPVVDTQRLFAWKIVHLLLDIDSRFDGWCQRTTGA